MPYVTMCIVTKQCFIVCEKVGKQIIITRLNKVLAKKLNGRIYMKTIVILDILLQHIQNNEEIRFKNEETEVNQIIQSSVKFH